MQRYVRKESYSIDKVLAEVIFEDKSYGRKHKVDFDGDLMNMTSVRYKCFKTCGVICAGCGIQANFFRKEKDVGQEKEIYHFNLYALDDNNEEILMTKDHIIPKSKGGANHISNYQTMCTHCNLKKSDKTIELIECCYCHEKWEKKFIYTVDTENNPLCNMCSLLHTVNLEKKAS